MHFSQAATRVVLWKGVLKTCSKFTGEHPCRRVISIKLLCFAILFGEKSVLYYGKLVKGYLHLSYFLDKTFVFYKNIKLLTLGKSRFTEFKRYTCVFSLKVFLSWYCKKSWNLQIYLEIFLKEIKVFLLENMRYKYATQTFHYY